MKLGVNIDHVASIRELRKGVQPEPIFAVSLCELAGADSIVVHLHKRPRPLSFKRSNKNQIKFRDVYCL